MNSESFKEYNQQNNLFQQQNESLDQYYQQQHNQYPYQNQWQQLNQFSEQQHGQQQNLSLISTISNNITSIHTKISGNN